MLPTCSLLYVKDLPKNAMHYSSLEPHRGSWGRCSCIHILRMRKRGPKWLTTWPELTKLVNFKARSGLGSQWSSPLGYNSLGSHQLFFFFLLLTLLQKSLTPHPHPACSSSPNPCPPWPSHTVVCVHGLCKYAYMFFDKSLPASPPACPLRSVSLPQVSMPLVLFCVSDCFVHWIPHVSKIIWYLLFSDWLILQKEGVHLYNGILCCYKKERLSLTLDRNPSSNFLRYKKGSYRIIK